MFARLMDRAFLRGLLAVGSVFKLKGAPVLHYHSVDGENRASVTRAAFSGQMLYLKENGFKVMALSEFAGLMKKGETLPPETIALTFDDGYETNYSIAFPVLQDMGFSATIFMTTARSGMTSDWQGARADMRLLSWDEAREMSCAGIEFGAHTETHPRLAAISVERAKEEIEGSKKRIEDELGKTARFFAYPYGDYNSAVKTLVSNAGFLAAFTIEPGLNSPCADLFELRRSGVFRDTTMNGFRTRLNGTFRWYYYTKTRLRSINPL
ncbi:MAG: polysaccharide deacetylase family protein [Deltaproteobacteria bacterium]|nr:polysaccharide deacetylase family protein [Deltaproteobacteria bacterium]